MLSLLFTVLNTSKSKRQSSAYINTGFYLVIDVTLSCGIIDGHIDPNFWIHRPPIVKLLYNKSDCISTCMYANKRRHRLHTEISITSTVYLKNNLVLTGTKTKLRPMMCCPHWELLIAALIFGHLVAKSVTTTSTSWRY